MADICLDIGLSLINLKCKDTAAENKAFSLFILVTRSEKLSGYCSAYFILKYTMQYVGLAKFQNLSTAQSNKISRICIGF